MESFKLKPKPSWEKADEEHKMEFSNYLLDKLGDIEIETVLGAQTVHVMSMMMILNGTVLKS